MDTLFDPIGEVQCDLQRVFAFGELVGCDEGFEEFVHPIPSDAVEPVCLEFGFRGGEEEFSSESLLALGEFIDDVVDLWEEVWLGGGL